MIELATITLTDRTSGNTFGLKAKDLITWEVGKGGVTLVTITGRQPMAVSETVAQVQAAINELWDQYNASLAGDFGFVTSYASGSAYSLTNSSAALNFGTADPELTLTQSGDWHITGAVKLTYTGATVAAETATLKLRKTSGTPADLDNSEITIDLPVATTLTHDWGCVPVDIVYEDALAADVITWYGQVSATLGAGTIDATAAWLVADRIG